VVAVETTAVDLEEIGEVATTTIIETVIFEEMITTIKIVIFTVTFEEMITAHRTEIIQIIPIPGILTTGRVNTRTLEITNHKIKTTNLTVKIQILDLKANRTREPIREVAVAVGKHTTETTNAAKACSTYFRTYQKTKILN